MAEEHKFIFVDINVNNNKFWNIRLLDNGDVITEWGRVGYSGDSKTFPNAGESFMRSKIKEKTRKGYEPARTISDSETKTSSVSSYSLESVAKSQIKTNNPLVESLIVRLAKANIHQILQSTTMKYDTSKGTFSTPLGVVDQTAIDQARDLLISIGNHVDAQAWDNDTFKKDVNKYLMLVPQNIGMGKLDLRRKFPDMDAVVKQNSIIDSLEASLQMVLSSKNEEDSSGKEEVEEPPKLFDLRLDLVENGLEIDRIRKYYKSTMQSMHSCHHLDVKTIYEIEMPKMLEAFQNDGAKLSNIWELWHGTNIANLLSILRSGLTCSPPNTTTINGRLYGNGIYFSDQSTKSLNYAYGYWSGTRNENCFMLLSQVAMGNYYTPKGTHESLPKSGYDSTFAKGGLSGTLNNEQIVYRSSQVNIIRLVEFSPSGK
jgi:poly [ADP-ribose] polymerase 2/3/4